MSDSGKTNGVRPRNEPTKAIKQQTENVSSSLNQSDKNKIQKMQSSRLRKRPRYIPNTSSEECSCEEDDKLFEIGDANVNNKRQKTLTPEPKELAGELEKCLSTFNKNNDSKDQKLDEIGHLDDSFLNSNDSSGDCSFGDKDDPPPPSYIPFNCALKRRRERKRPLKDPTLAAIEQLSCSVTSLMQEEELKHISLWKLLDSSFEKLPEEKVLYLKKNIMNMTNAALKENLEKIEKE